MNDNNRQRCNSRFLHQPHWWGKKDDLWCDGKKSVR